MMRTDPQAQHLAMMRAMRYAMRRREDQPFPEWQVAARERLGALLGLPEAVCPSDLRIEWTREEEGVRELRLTFRTEPEYETRAHLLIPASETPVPVVICLQGHSKGMHISLGRPKYPGDAESIAGDRDFARQAVRHGCAAFVLEQRGFGECGGTEDGPACHQPAMAALLLGRTLIGERVWDVMRSIDLIEARFPKLDAGRVAVLGNSGGGTTSLYAAAMDPRIAAAVPSCAFSGFEASIGAQLHCVCNYVPGIMKSFDMGDIAGMIAPRPLVLVSGRHDGIFPLQQAEEQFSIAQAYYTAAGAEDKLRHVIGAEGHRFYAEQAWQALRELTGWPLHG